MVLLYSGDWCQNQTTGMGLGVVSIVEAIQTGDKQAKKNQTKQLKPDSAFTISSTTIELPEGTEIAIGDDQMMTSAWYGTNLTQGVIVPIDSIVSMQRVGNAMGVGDPVPGMPKKLWINVETRDEVAKEQRAIKIN